MQLRKKHKQLLLTFLLLLLATVFFARPGGGHSYSGGTGHTGGYSGNYSSPDGTIIYLLFRALPPEISIPLVLIILFFVFLKNQKAKDDDFMVVSSSTSAHIRNKSQEIAKLTARLKAIDPNFSYILLLDFVWLLYTRFYTYINDPKKLLEIQAFFKSDFLSSIIKMPVSYKINQIVIGNIAISALKIDEENVKVTFSIKANMTIEAEKKAERYLITEKWTFERKRNVHSPEPSKMKALRCPSCGAPAYFTDSGYCNYCDTYIAPGEMHWALAARAVEKMQIISTNQLFAYSAEAGTTLPTVKDPFLHKRMAIFAKTHNTNWSDYWKKFESQIVIPYFEKIYDAWSNLKWEDARAYTSDRLWEANKFWIDLYKANNARNILQIKVVRIDAAKIDIDRYYESITVRIFASGLDYIVDKNGKLIAGSKKHSREYSEYWTFIRRTGVEEDKIPVNCPACGAPLDNINSHGICDYCGNKITDGNFSWIVTLIVQDEEYSG